MTNTNNAASLPLLDPLSNGNDAHTFFAAGEVVLAWIGEANLQVQVVGPADAAELTYRVRGLWEADAEWVVGWDLLRRLNRPRWQDRRG